MRHLPAVLALVAMLTGVGAQTVTPARTVAYSNCPAGFVCLWDDPNAFGNPTIIVFRNPGLCYSVPSGFNDRADSFYNHLTNGHHVQFYRDHPCTGLLLRQTNNNRSGGPFPPGTMDNFIAARGINHRNQLTSIWFNNG